LVKQVVFFPYEWVEIVFCFFFIFAKFRKVLKFEKKKNLPGWQNDILELMSGSGGRGSRVGGERGARTGFSGEETGRSGVGRNS